MSEEITITPKVDAIGRIMIPKHVRDALGIEPGDLAEIVVRRKDISRGS
jgi:AbrB family looped-hinge helix DNA binding protein